MVELARRNDPNGYGLMSAVFGFLTLALAVAALAVASQALVESGEGGGAAVPVTLSEFHIDPADVSVPVGGSLSVQNAGAVEHNLAVQGTDLITPNLRGGESATLDVSSLEKGTYTLFCKIPGHKDAGMVAKLHVGVAATGGTAAGSHEMTEAQNDAADKAMAAVVAGFPAETEGAGNQPLAPTVLADGTLQFELTAKVVDWELEPGKTVQAWTYNGMVPGPWIKVSSGDKVRVVLKNELKQSTSIHFHGLYTPNSMDGVPPITQEPVKPGETFNYEFVARGPALGMYHSHHHAVHQVPDGMAGIFQIDDPPVPAGVTVSQQVPMVLNDAGVIGYSLNGKSFPATAPIVAKVGEWIEIHYLNEGAQVHPMHLHGMPTLVIAKDGIPLDQPYLVDVLTVAPGERYTVLVHATEPGVWAYHCHILPHVEHDDGTMFGMVTALVVQ